jgi:hypothetical protein
MYFDGTRAYTVVARSFTAFGGSYAPRGGGVGQGARAKTRNLIYTANSVESAVFGWSMAY